MNNNRAASNKTTSSSGGLKPKATVDTNKKILPNVANKAGANKTSNVKSNPPSGETSSTTKSNSANNKPTSVTTQSNGTNNKLPAIGKPNQKTPSKTTTTAVVSNTKQIVSPKPPSSTGPTNSNSPKVLKNNGNINVLAPAAASVSDSGNVNTTENSLEATTEPSLLPTVESNASKAVGGEGVVATIGTIQQEQVVQQELAVEIEAPPPPPIEINNNGKVKLIYERYDEMFQIVNGTTTQENIDEEYCLSFVMPDCLIHLSIYEPTIKRQREADGIYHDLYLREEPQGTYHGLLDDGTYYVYVEQEAEQLARDQEIMRQRAAGMEGAIQRDENGDIIRPDDGRAMESCSCIYGNPCVDEYGCKDWTNRYAIAKKNGWKGF